MNELINKFCDWLEGTERSPKTIKSYKDKIVGFSKYLADHQINIKSVTSEQFENYLQYLLIRKKNKGSTRSLAYTAINRFYEYLIIDGLINYNPVVNVKSPKCERKVKGTLTNDEITLLIHAPDLKTEIGMRDTAILAFFTSTGARVSALSKLRVNDIRAEEVHVPPKCPYCGQRDYSGKSRLRYKKELIPIVTLHEKGNKTWDIPLNNKAAFYLNQYLIQRKYGNDSNIVFPGYRRSKVRPVSRHGFYRLIKKYAAKAGIKGNIKPHDLRRAAITWLLDCGISEMTVKDYVGHSNLTTTETYRNVTHRSFMFAGIAGEKSLLEAIDTPMDSIIEGIK